jgi:cytosine/adenosine deaminase-related metal-dependent hydrolase
MGRRVLHADASLAAMAVRSVALDRITNGMEVPMTPATTPHRTILLGPDRHGMKAVFYRGALVWHGHGEPELEVSELDHLPCPEAVIQRGYVNAHTHLYSALIPFGIPLPDPWPRHFVPMLQRLWWRLDRALDLPALRAAVRVALGEALLHGTTTLVDHHESPNAVEGSLDVIAEEVQALGARAILCYGATERNQGRTESQSGLRECARFARVLRDRPANGHLAGLIGLHAPFTLSDGTIRDAAGLALDLGIGLHVHAAESLADLSDARRRGYRGVVDRLDALGAVKRGTILAHGVHVTLEEVDLVNARGAWFVQNPRSNRGSGVGYPGALGGPFGALRVALGTDGYPSHMREEVLVAREDGAPFSEPPNLPIARLEAGRELAALHLGEAVHADLVAMTLEGAVHAVVGGEVVVRDRRLVHADIGELRAEAMEAATVVGERMRYL